MSEWDVWIHVRSCQFECDMTEKSIMCSAGWEYNNDNQKKIIKKYIINIVQVMMFHTLYIHVPVLLRILV